jgi:hypothetical protein
MLTASLHTHLTLSFKNQPTIRLFIILKLKRIFKQTGNQTIYLHLKLLRNNERLSFYVQFISVSLTSIGISGATEIYICVIIRNM